MIRLPRPIGLCLLATFGLGCQPPTSGGEQAQATPPAAAAKPDASTPKPIAKPAEPTPANASAHAYVDVAHAGVFVIDEEGWRLAFSSRSPVRDIAVIGDQLVVLTSFGVQRVEAIGKTEPLATLDKASYEQLGEPRAMAGDGERFWVLGDEAVGRWDAGWTLTPWASITSASVSPGPTSVAIDLAGNPWLLADTVKRPAKDGWAPVALTLGFEPKPVALVSSEDRQTILVHAGCQSEPEQPQMRCAVVRFVADAATTVEFDAPTCPDPGLLALDSHGTRAAIASACGLVRLDLAQPGGAAKLTSAGEWVGGVVRSVAIDDGGRVWAGVGHTLVIVDPDAAPQRYPLAQLTEISGAIDHLVVTGPGPTAPTLGEAQRGGIKATLVHGDQPLANAEVELCREPATTPDPARSACAGAESVTTATTDADGNLAVADLPLGEYTFAVELDGRWVRGLAKSPTMRGGMTGNIGKIVLAP